jgi:Zn-dependent peptidase ImmA (M78 family)
MQPTNNSTFLLGQFPTPISILTRLRALIPDHDLALNDLLQLIDLQAATLLMLSNVSHAPTPSEVVVAIPSIRVEDTRLPLSGFSYWNGRQWILSLHADEPHPRRRFTLLHEFAHIVWHGYERGLFPNLSATAASHLAELAANYFAGAVLLPRHLLLHAWHRGDRNVDQLAAMFHVSRQTVAIGLAQLGLSRSATIDIPFLRPPRTTPTRAHSQVQRSFRPSARRSGIEVAS